MQNQHDFCPGHSCTGQLLTVMEDWTKSLDSREETDIIFPDFKKLSITFLVDGLTKVQAYGINGALLNWFISFKLITASV